MKGKIFRAGSALATGVLLAAVAAIVVPLALAGGQPQSAKRAAFQSCTQTALPTFPLELNSAATGVLVKSVAMEKDIFTCQDASGPTGSRDLETFVELVDRESGGSLGFLSAKVLTATCDKRLASSSSVTCGKTSISTPSAPGPNATQCSPRLQLDDPVEMNTVATGDSLFVKTIKLEKEPLSCNDGTTNNDLYLFTQLVEPVHADLLGIDDPTFTWLGVFCNQNRFQGVLTGCVRFTPGSAINAPGTFSCTDTNGPTFPLEQNTAAAGHLVKTVAMEKDILSCNPTNTSDPHFTRDLETFVDVIDRQSGSSLGFLTAKAFASTCDKTFTSAATTVACAAKKLPLVAGPAPNLQACGVGRQLADPVVMNTARTLDGKVVKTIKVEKEIFSCGNVMRDLYVFTQLIEPVNAAGDNFTTTNVRVLGVYCDRDTTAGAITGCIRFTPGPLL
ncbi:MAG TPA: hypothetical protein VFA66_06520 [Gaiellaceae bacterium]|nr:hypothetical protein [Gaiellaceae bacterium]